MLRSRVGDGQKQVLQMVEVVESCWDLLEVCWETLVIERSPRVVLVGSSLMLKSVWYGGNSREKVEKVRGEGKCFWVVVSIPSIFLFHFLGVYS